MDRQKKKVYIFFFLSRIPLKKKSIFQFTIFGVVNVSVPYSSIRKIKFQILSLQYKKKRFKIEDIIFV